MQRRRLYSFGTANMTGLVCGTAASLEVSNISFCCIEGTWGVRGLYTWYCETDDISECAVRRKKNIDSSGDPVAGTAYSGFCTDANASGDG
jgi:hypothetical protein